MIKICPLFSGSSGNSIFISCRNTASTAMLPGMRRLSGTSVLVDAGMNAKQTQCIMQSIGETLEEVSGILLTHEHIDHMRGIGVITRRFRIPVYLNEKTYQSMMQMDVGHIPDGLIRIIKNHEPFTVGDFLVQSHQTSHDSADSIGYRVSFRDRDVSVFTDLGQIDSEIIDFAAGSQAVFIESNYDVKMLWEGTYPYFLKRRIDGTKGHLSNDECARSVRSLLERGTQRFILSHLSQENNRPSTALKTTLSHLNESGAHEGADFLIQVARRLEPGEMWDLS